MEHPERRRHQRYLSHLPVELACSRRIVSGTTMDVSQAGMMLVTHNPPAARQLVQVDLVLPSDHMGITLQAMVFRVVPRMGGHAGSYGVGLQFFGMTQQDEERWLDYLLHAHAHQPAARVAHERRMELAAHPPSTPVFDLRCDSVDGLLERYAQELSVGGLFIETSARLLVGTQVRVRVVHPTTRGVFTLEGMVVRKRASSTRDGIAVRFPSMPLGWKTDFLTFLGNSEYAPWVRPVANMHWVH